MPTFKEWAEDLAAVNPDERAGFIRDTLKSKKNLHIFGRYFFPHIIKGEDEVPPCHQDLIAEISRREDSGVIFPRGHAKSTWEKIDTIHDITYGLEPVILYISVTLTDAGFHFESIKSEFENNDLLIDIYGYLVPDEKQLGRKWTNKHLQTTNGVNLVARGAGKGRGVNIKNKRPTKIIADDIEDDESVSSPEQRQKLHNWLYNVIFPSKDKDRGFIKMIGTALHPHAEVIQFHKKHGGIYRRAIENGKPIWFTKEQLDTIKEKIGTRAFNQEYMNNPSAEEDQIIKESWITSNYYVQTLDLRTMHLVLMVDPQSGESASADEMGIAVVAWQVGKPDRYVIESAGVRDGLTKKAGIVIDYWQKYKERIRLVGIEVVMNQNALWQLLVEWKNGKDVIPGYGHIVDRNIPLLKIEPKGKDKTERLKVHEPAFERGEVHLRPDQQELKDQLVNFPNVDHDDRMDALLYGLEHSNYASQPMKTSERAKGGTIAGNVMKMQF